MKAEIKVEQGDEEVHQMGTIRSMDLEPATRQHAALIGGPNATSCPLCHKMFLGGEALMEHMKHTHKDPNASGVAKKEVAVQQNKEANLILIRMGVNTAI
nr:unnamed protein product [Callosobruchus analis]